mmetsp:Transcript_53787/g.172432  ORF Transcript_53787/g.172432 Transcript_53787/m.172432 type:complete len:212 (-) Transcript_53787:231-866(-)
MALGSAMEATVKSLIVTPSFPPSSGCCTTILIWPSAGCVPVTRSDSSREIFMRSACTRSSVMESSSSRLPGFKSDVGRIPEVLPKDWDEEPIIGSSSDSWGVSAQCRPMPSSGFHFCAAVRWSRRGGAAPTTYGLRPAAVPVSAMSVSEKEKPRSRRERPPAVSPKARESAPMPRPPRSDPSHRKESARDLDSAARLKASSIAEGGGGAEA